MQGVGTRKQRVENREDGSRRLIVSVFDTNVPAFLLLQGGRGRDEGGGVRERWTTCMCVSRGELLTGVAAAVLLLVMFVILTVVLVVVIVVLEVSVVLALLILFLLLFIMVVFSVQCLMFGVQCSYVQSCSSSVFSFQLLHFNVSDETLS